MNSKKIANIVFYKDYKDNSEAKKAYIFYQDGTYKEVSYDEAIKGCLEVAKENNIGSKDAFRKMINKNIIHVVSKEELNKNFLKYIPVSEIAEKESKKLINKEENKLENNKQTKKKSKKGFFKKLAVRLTSIGLAAAVGCGLYSCTTRISKKGRINSNNTISANAEDDNIYLSNAYVNTNANTNRNTDNTNANTSRNIDNTNANTNRNTDNSMNALVFNNNDYYDNYTYEQLLEVTSNSFQKESMTKLGNTIQDFNGRFASAHLENGKNIKAALSFDELVALQTAYNDYSKTEIRAYFNGADIRSDDMTRAYKDASLQLMGAYAIETRENRVDMSKLIDSEEGKVFYNRYHELFLAAKEATGKDKLNYLNSFFKAVKEDFPITEEIRTEGIAHADSRSSLKSYELSVAPMIAAAEMMYQNLDIDYTLDDSQIDFLNDIGLCNYADHTFERIETVVLTSIEDNTNPLYEQYRNSIIRMMSNRNEYVIDDDHRDLSQLDAFQDAVNWHFDAGLEYVGGVYYTTETHEETTTWSESNTTYTERRTVEEAEIPADEKARIDREIDNKNKKAKSDAEKAAEENRKRMQEAADREAERIQQEIREEEKDLQNNINKANEQINRNHDDDKSNDKKVNESDFGGHNVDFDDKHSDSNGNLNDSVENITTDSTGDQTGKDLPDSNQTGAIFDMKVSNSSSSSSSQYMYVSEEDFVEIDNTDTETVTEQEVENEVVTEEPTNPETSTDEPVVEEPVDQVTPIDDSGDTVTEPVVETETVVPDTTSENVGYIEYIDDNTYIEYPSDYIAFDENGEPIGSKSNEEIVNEYVEAMANTDNSNEDSYQYKK